MAAADLPGAGPPGTGGDAAPRRVQSVLFMCAMNAVRSPMAEALAECAIDISGRPFLAWSVPFARDKVGEMDTELFEEFFRALAFNAGITISLLPLPPLPDCCSLSFSLLSSSCACCICCCRY